jgi:predicted nucleic acid-binding protein
MTLVFNASPLIVLAKAGLLDRILPLADQTWIPQAVAEEVSRAKNPGDPASRWIAGQSSLIHPTTPISPFVMAWDLGAGESAVISLTATNATAVAVLDDLAARRCAQAMGLPIVGSLGLILMAKRAGVISSATQALDAVVAAGLFISRQHLDAVCIQAGEAVPRCDQ